MRGLYKSTGYWSTVYAWRDWEAEVELVRATGDAELIALAERLQPAEGSGHRRVDKALAALRQARLGADDGTLR